MDFFAIRTERREQAEMALPEACLGSCRPIAHAVSRADERILAVVNFFEDSGKGKFVAVRDTATEHAGRMRYPFGNGREAWPKT
jgi:hypothetical protein